MADETPFKGGRLGPFHLGRRYKHKDLGAGLGRLYEAHNVHTGSAALVLMPDRHADWEPMEDWRLSASSHVSPPYVALEVERAPASGRLPALSELLDLLASAIERVERNTDARAHLTREPIGLLRRWRGRSGRWLRSRRGLATASLSTVVLGVGLWLGFSGLDKGPEPTSRLALGVGAEAAARLDSPTSVGTDDQRMAAIAYPMPGGPFRDQAKAPSSRGSAARTGLRASTPVDALSPLRAGFAPGEAPDSFGARTECIPAPGAESPRRHLPAPGLKPCSRVRVSLRVV